VNVANRGLELDKRMCRIMGVDGRGLTRRTEIGIRADSTLVPVAIDPTTTVFVGTQRTITVNTVVLGCVSSGVHIHSRKWVINGDKAMSMVVEWRSDNALGAVVPVGAAHALMSNAVDFLYLN
jgi:hypothetical protein